MTGVSMVSVTTDSASVVVQQEEWYKLRFEQPEEV